MKTVQLEKKEIINDLKISVYLSFDDLLVFEKAENNEIGYKEAIITSILSKTQNTSKRKITDKIIKQYILYVLQSNKDLNKYYNSLLIDNEYEHFVKACLNYQRFKYSKLSDSIKTLSRTIEPKIIEITKQLSETLEDIGIVKLREQYITNIAQMMIPVTETLKKYSDEAIIDGISRLKETFSKLYDAIDFSGIPKLAKTTYKTQYESWGKVGWTVLPGLEYYYMNHYFINKRISNAKMMRIINKYNIVETIFKNLKHSSFRESDINQAIKMYKLEEYKLCAMMLFSLIDNGLIRSQNVDRANIKRRKVCNKAVDRFEKKHKLTIESQPANDCLFFYNLMVAINTTFSDADDFKKQTEVINRNMLLHGMMYKKVTKTDCVQLFLILFNFDLIIELIKNQ